MLASRSGNGRINAEQQAEDSVDGTDAITLSGVSFSWPGSQTFDLKVQDFAVSQQEKILVIGPSGSGKSTLLSLICGIVVADQGDLIVLGNNQAKLSQARRDRFRADHFGIIFQMFNLLPYGSVLDNVILPLSFAQMRKARVDQEGDSVQEAKRLLTRLGLEESLAEAQSTSRLSVGQQQRVAAARALIGRPEIVVADEPTSALDRDRQRAFLDLLFEEVARAKSSLIMVSHDESLADPFDRVVYFYDIAATNGALG